MSSTSIDPIFPLHECIEHVRTIGGVTYENTKIVVKILQQIVEHFYDEDSQRFRNLNGAKVLPRIVPEKDLVLWYILIHAGFVRQNDRLICGSDVSIDKVKFVLSSLESLI